MYTPVFADTSMIGTLLNKLLNLALFRLKTTCSGPVNMFSLSIRFLLPSGLLQKPIDINMDFQDKDVNKYSHENAHENIRYEFITVHIQVEEHTT